VGGVKRSLHKLTHKIQDGFPVSYNVCEVKLDKLTIGYVYRGRIFSCDGILKYKLKVGLFIGCAKTLKEANVYSHYNKTNRYVIGTKAKSLDLGMT
jgi:serine/threonine-protein kinase RIO1